MKMDDLKIYGILAIVFYIVAIVTANSINSKIGLIYFILTIVFFFAVIKEMDKKNIE